MGDLTFIVWALRPCEVGGEGILSTFWVKKLTRFTRSCGGLRSRSLESSSWGDYILCTVRSSQFCSYCFIQWHLLSTSSVLTFVLGIEPSKLMGENMASLKVLSPLESMEETAINLVIIELLADWSWATEEEINHPVRVGKTQKRRWKGNWILSVESVRSGGKIGISRCSRQRAWRNWIVWVWGAAAWVSLTE